MITAKEALNKSERAEQALITSQFSSLKNRLEVLIEDSISYGATYAQLEYDPGKNRSGEVVIADLKKLFGNHGYTFSSSRLYGGDEYTPNYAGAKMTYRIRLDWGEVK